MCMNKILFTEKVFENIILKNGLPSVQASTLQRPTLERRKTVGHIRSINPNMTID